MNSTAPAHRWSVATIGDPEHHRVGTATTHSDAWVQALAAGRAALLAGELNTLAITVDDDQPIAFYTPARDEHGNLDPADVTADLVEIQQNATIGELADQLAAGLIKGAGNAPQIQEKSKDAERAELDELGKDYQTSLSRRSDSKPRKLRR